VNESVFQSKDMFVRNQRNNRGSKQSGLQPREMEPQRHIVETGRERGWKPS